MPLEIATASSMCMHLGQTTIHAVVSVLSAVLDQPSSRRSSHHTADSDETHEQREGGKMLVILFCSMETLTGHHSG